jgi:hypothetical protein
MFVLQTNVASNDGKFQLNITSNNIRVVTPNVSVNTEYYHNFQLKFNGTFIPSQKSVYIATIYNYFLIKYNLELIGDVECVSGSIMFAAGVDQSGTSDAQQLLINGLINDANLILPGYPLVKISLGSYQTNVTNLETTTVPPSISSSTTTTRTSSTKTTTKRLTSTITMPLPPVSGFFMKLFSLIKKYLFNYCIAEFKQFNEKDATWIINWMHTWNFGD